MVLIALSLVASCVLLVLIAVAARSRLGIEGVCTLSGATAILFLFCLFSGALFLRGVLTVIAVLVCRGFTRSPRTIVQASAAAMVVSYAIMLSLGISELRERARLREEYPLVSIARRLDYEKTAEEPGKAEAIPLSAPVEQRLKDAERRFGMGTRSFMLASLHRRTSDEFHSGSWIWPRPDDRGQTGTH